ncbi:phage integrase central domain-containing protein, partial [Streptomyces sp. BE303]|uniref:phage integrase central domain-containing protein n=1 Tax=Streptomyces sp. BE303 TaxID=3002528 RepID=UPI002E99D535|nr:hypothetical protein [Streptomyces sp. BE303]
MRAVLDGELPGVYENRRTTIASHLREWLATRKPHLAPNTFAGYAACVERDLVPAFGHLRLLDLRPEHIDAWVAAQLEAQRGRVTVHRAVSTLRNALNAAVHSRRLRYNPAKHSVPPKPRAAERTCWTPEQAATFLQHGAEQYADQLTDKRGTQQPTTSQASAPAAQPRPRKRKVDPVVEHARLLAAGEKHLQREEAARAKEAARVEAELAKRQAARRRAEEARKREDAQAEKEAQRQARQAETARLKAMAETGTAECNLRREELETVLLLRPEGLELWHPHV